MPDDRNVTNVRDFGERFAGKPITPSLLRGEADRLEDTPAAGAASWAMGEVAWLLHRVASVLEATPQVATITGSEPLDCDGPSITPKDPDGRRLALIRTSSRRSGRWETNVYEVKHHV
jgi:hypothetical protein